jgi:hypothetical protein
MMKEVTTQIKRNDIILPKHSGNTTQIFDAAHLLSQLRLLVLICRVFFDGIVFQVP